MNMTEVEQAEQELHKAKQHFIRIRDEASLEIRAAEHKLNEARLANRPTYPTQEILDGIKVLKDLKPPKRQTGRNTGLCRSMTYDAKDSMVTIMCNAPHNVITGEKLWTFTAEDIAVIHKAFEDHGFEITNVVPMRNNNVVVFTVYP